MLSLLARQRVEKEADVTPGVGETGARRRQAAQGAGVTGRRRGTPRRLAAATADREHNGKQQGRCSSNSHPAGHPLQMVSAASFFRKVLWAPSDAASVIVYATDGFELDPVSGYDIEPVDPDPYGLGFPPKVGGRQPPGRLNVHTVASDLERAEVKRLFANHGHDGPLTVAYAVAEDSTVFVLPQSIIDSLSDLDDLIAALQRVLGGEVGIVPASSAWPDLKPFA